MRQGQSKIVWKRILTNGDDEIEIPENMSQWEIQKQYPKHTLVNRQCVVFPELTNEQRSLIDYYSQPADYKAIQAGLLRLAVHKRMTGDDNEKAIRLREYINRLKGVTELQLFDVVEWFIENDKGDFFPNISVLKEKLN